MNTATDFRKILAGLSTRRAQREVFTSFLTLSACALSAGAREAEYRAEAERWQPEEMQAFSHAFGSLIEEMDEEPMQDVLGAVHMDQLGSRGQSHGGEFHTPAAVCQLMAEVSIADRIAEWDRLVAEQGHVSVMEPACGAGATILGLARALHQMGRADLIRRLRVTGVDVSRAACDMFFINTTLWGIPALVIHGDTLRLQTWGRWNNVHLRLPLLRLLA